MTAEQFAYWLRGFTELTADQQPTPEQWKSITEHLHTVFNKVTPPVQFRVDKETGRSAELRLSDLIGKRDDVWPDNPPTITC